MSRATMLEKKKSELTPSHRPQMNARGHIQRALARWPRDTVRPAVQLPGIMGPALTSETPASEEQQLFRQANALYSLLDDRYKKMYPIDSANGIVGSVMRPRSDPHYFAKLLLELDEAPNRSWLQRTWLRVKGTVRLQ
ncbi:hypothetical protein GGR56DRAFT_675100 [Xylariaceae sp. FL0804]|nr:hypothetical protein GGR56DRAFT_675100 [Xylariaceae sp. FL0804]